VSADLSTLSSNSSKTFSNDLTIKYDNNSNVWQNSTIFTKIDTALAINSTTILTTTPNNSTGNRTENQLANNDKNDY
jgi:hypothetical protein